LLSISHIYLKAKGKGESNLDIKIVFFKKRIEFVFVFLMALFLIYLFNPKTSKIVEISGQSKTLLFLFGVVLLITADWQTFIHESLFFINLQKILGQN
jgi:hypothetical protein